MSLITRCPACQTLFKVVPDQLRISEGWVRCGQCDEIFDASSHLLPSTPDVSPAHIDNLTDSSQSPAGNHIPFEQVPELEPAQTDVADPTEAINNSIDAPTELLVNEQVSSTLLPPDMFISEPLELSHEPAETPAPDISTSLLADQDAPLENIDCGTDGHTELNQVSFLRIKDSGAFWRKPLVRVALIAVCLTLLLGLAGQVVFHERDRIAASEPGLKSWLQAFCSPFDCALSPLRKIESIVIDSASFTKIRGDSYRLNFTIKNNEALALALPAIELTLTDTLDQAVIRKVFLPSELGVKSEALEASREWTVSLAVAIKDAGSAGKVAGYRVLAFYP